MIRPVHLDEILRKAIIACDEGSRPYRRINLCRRIDFHERKMWPYRDTLALAGLIVLCLAGSWVMK